MLFLNKYTDEDLLALIKNGHEHAWELVYKKYWQQLYSSAFAVLKNEQICEDIIQDIFMKLWTERDRLKIEISIPAYLKTCVRHEVYRKLRSGRMNEDIFDEVYQKIVVGLDFNDIEYKEMNGQINIIVERLPEKCKLVYKLSREEYLSNKQISERLNISIKTVENHMTKALGFLKTAMGQLTSLIFIGICIYLFL